MTVSNKESLDCGEGKQRKPSPFVLKEPLNGKYVVIITLVVAFFFSYYFFLNPPRNFPKDKMMRIQNGDTARAVAESFGKEKIVRYPFVLINILLLSGQGKNIIAGDYFFSEPIGAFKVAQRIVTGEFDLTPIRVTIPEGMASFEMVKLFGNSFYYFDEKKFLKLAEEKEGYLFPDTYFIFPNATTEEIVGQLSGTFNAKISKYEQKIKTSGKNIKDIIIMASIIEREAKKPEDKNLVSGILWKRFYIKMPLQVDAPFAYISDKNTYELTEDDLKQDSPYNTYKHLGLPPGPISTPGIESILAAISPKQSQYLYYLSDRSGNMHYAATFEEHKRNKILYVNSL